MTEPINHSNDQNSNHDNFSDSKILPDLETKNLDESPNNNLKYPPNFDNKTSNEILLPQINIESNNNPDFKISNIKIENGSINHNNFSKISDKIKDRFHHQPLEEDYGNNDSYSLNGSPERLKRELNNVKNEINEKDCDLQNLDGEIKELKSKLSSALDNEYQLKKRVDARENERKILQEVIYKLEDRKYSLEQRLKKAENLKTTKKNKSQVDIEESFREAQNLQLQDLFKKSEPIENTVLYVATFFPRLSPQDFERVVSYLLEERTTPTTVHSKVTTDRGDTRLIEEYQDKSLVKIWQESLYQPEKYLEKCYLKAEILEDNSQIIEFYIPLRDRLKILFKDEQSLYLSAQFKRARYLLFNESEGIADSAMELIIEMALTSPLAYGEDWLFDIVINNFSEALQNLANKPEITRKEIVFKRISSLITQMLGYPRLESIANKFLQKLIKESQLDALMEIIKGLDSAPKFEQFYWIRQLIDRTEENKLCDNACSFLYDQLTENGSRIYEILDIIKSWLPELNLPVEQYSGSNKFALSLVFLYCLETTYEIEPKYYGCWQDKNRHPLFAFLIINPFDDQRWVEDKLEILVTYLFHPGLESVIKKENILVETDDISPELQLRLITSSLISEWSKILIPDQKWFLLEKINPIPIDPKALKIFEKLLIAIINKTQSKQQKELIDTWTLLSNFYLEEGRRYEVVNNRKLSKRTNLEWHNVRRVSKQFKALQKEIK